MFYGKYLTPPDTRILRRNRSEKGGNMTKQQIKTAITVIIAVLNFILALL